ncbi:hypothetical protein BsWGS_27417 [Bradybaena similaris]
MNVILLLAGTVVCLLAPASGGSGQFDLCFNAMRVCDPDPCVNYYCPTWQTCRTCDCQPACYNSSRVDDSPT